MRIVLSIYIIAGILVGCAPNELPENVIAEPVFYAEGTLDGSEFSLLAGPDNVTVSSSSELVEGEISLYNVVFEQEDCESCEELAIDIRGMSYEADLTLEDILPLGEYTPSQFEGNEFSGNFELSTQSGSSYSLFLSDSEGDESGSGQNFEVESGEYLYVLVGSSQDGNCSVEVLGSAILGSDGDADIVQLMAGEDSEGEYIEIPASPMAVVTITSVNDEVVLTSIGERIYLNTLPVPASDVQSITVQFEVGGFGSGFQGDYSFANGLDINCLPFIFVEPSSESSEALPMSVALTYKSTQGVEYSEPSGTDDFFIIHSITPYADDPLGREAYTVQFTCGLSLASEDSGVSALQLEITDGIIPIVIE